MDKTTFREYIKPALVLVIMILGMRCSGLVGSANDETQCRVIATEYAHTKLKAQNFKNPNSLQINNTDIGNEFDDEEYYYYKIIVDYSAQNGFGGYNRDAFEVVVKVNKATRQAIPIDFAEYVEAYSSYVDKLK